MSAPEPTGADPSEMPASGNSATAETAALARGGRATFLGYVLRLAARFPFLFIAGRLYGATSLGEFAYAAMVVELVAMLATLGLKRGLAEEMARRGPAGETHALIDALVVAVAAAAIGAAALMALPALVFPASAISSVDRLFPLIIVAIVVSDICLAALAFRHDIAATVRARSLIEPWTLSLAALVLAYTPAKPDGLIIAYLLSLVAAAIFSLIPAWRSFGDVPRWRPDFPALARLVRANGALAGADISEWGARRLDIFILGRFASAEIVGIYYVAQQIASLPQRLKSSFDPILAPVLATNLATGALDQVAAHIRQVSFWVGAIQLAAVLSLGFVGQAGMGLFGPAFAAGAAVLAMLFAAEVLAAQAAVAEAALIYVSRGTNLLWSLAGILLQLALSLVLVPRFGGLGAAAALGVSAMLLSIVKSRLLAHRLRHPVLGWRWGMVPATAAGALTGAVIMTTPEPFQLTLGWMIIAAAYGTVVWRLSFKGPDRLLFTTRLRRPAPAPAL